jgi:hypothetical protein
MISERRAKFSSSRRFEQGFGQRKWPYFRHKTSKFCRFVAGAAAIDSSSAGLAEDVAGANGCAVCLLTPAESCQKRIKRSRG